MDRLRLDLADETFHDELRAAMLSAGATEGEIDVLAVFQVNRVVECTDARSEARHEQIEWIARRLSRTDMIVRIGKDDASVQVEFPSRSQVH